MNARWRSRISVITWKRAMPVLLCLIAGVHLLLIGAKLSSARLSGFAETDYLQIETKTAFTTADLLARNLRVVGVSSLELPGGEVLAGELTLVIGEDANARATGTSIPAFEIGAGSSIYLTVDREEQQLSLAMETKELRLELIPPPGTEVRIDGAECTNGTCHFVYQGSSPFYLNTVGKTALVEIRMDLAEEARTLADRIAVSAIQLWELQHFQGTVERRGAIKNGSLRFLEAPEQAYALERGTVVDLKPAGIVLRGLEVKGESIYLHLSGRVEDVSVKIGDAEHSLMPTWFDKVSRNPHLRMGLGIISILLGGGLTLIQSIAQNTPSTEPSDVSPSEESSNIEKSEPGRSPLTKSPPMDTPS